NERFEHLKACDLIVSRAGHGTITQSMFYGKPMILIPTPNHTEQIGNASRVEEMGLGLALEQEELTRETLLNSIEKIIDGGFVERSREVSKELRKYDGCERIISLIEELL
ncbi:MAG: glycosyltransferase, partial [Nitrososphaerales archaeon]